MIIEQLIKEIESKPVSMECSHCKGTKEVQSSSWACFIKKYGDECLDSGSKFDIAETELYKESVLISERKDFLVSKGLTEDEASDFVELILEANDIEECEECDDKGMVLTEHGERVLALSRTLNIA